MTLVMLHVWFVPSPDGPFAGTNPNLPFWAVGLAAPDASRMHDPAFKSRVYRASLALAEVADTTSILPSLEQRPDVKASLFAHRDTIRTLIPELLAAQKSKDAAPLGPRRREGGEAVGRDSGDVHRERSHRRRKAAHRALHRDAARRARPLTPKRRILRPRATLRIAVAK